MVRVMVNLMKPILQQHSEVKPNLWIAKWNRDSEAKQMVSVSGFIYSPLWRPNEKASRGEKVSRYIINLGSYENESNIFLNLL